LRCTAGGVPAKTVFDISCARSSACATDAPAISTKIESVSPYLTGFAAPAPPATRTASSRQLRPDATIASARSAHGWRPENDAAQ